MIYDAAIFADDSGCRVLRAPHTVSEYVRRVGGFLFFAHGGVVLYMFLSGRGPLPIGSGAPLAFGWLILAVFAFAAGVLPLCWGITTFFVIGSFRICVAQRFLEYRLAICGVHFWVRRYQFDFFHRISISHSRWGFPSSRDHFLVSGVGPSRCVRFSTSTDLSASELLANTIAADFGVPIEKLCPCCKFADIIRVDDHELFVQTLKKLEVGSWGHLCQCRFCQQLWFVDEWDKYQRQFVVRIPAREGWREFDTVPFRKRFLVEAAGGTTDEKCIWAGCEGRRVRGVVYCADHLYATGARE